MTNDTYEIQISGKHPIEFRLDDTKDISCVFKRLGVRSTTRTPLEENGGYKYTYKLDSLDDITILAEEKVIAGKNKKNSQRLRNALYYISKERDEDEGEFYDKVMNKLCVPDNLDKVINLLLN